MGRYLLIPTAEQAAVMRGHCAHARFVWNLAVEQQSWWRRGRHHGQVWVPKAGWVRFRWSRAVPDARSYRVTLDRSGRWHIAFAALPALITGPGTGEVMGVDRGVAVSAALSTGEMLNAPRPSPGGQRRLLILQRKLDLRIASVSRSAEGTLAEPGRNVRAKAGLNRAILDNGWGLLVKRLEDKAPGRVERVSPAFTSQTCSACGIRDREARESQASFRCRSCGHAENADVNAARNIAAGHAVTARGGTPQLGRPLNRGPQAA